MSKEFKVGLLVVIAGVVLYFGFQFLKGSDLFSTTNTYYVKYASIGGLQESNPVKLKGMPVGRVQGLRVIQGEEIDSVEVELMLEEGYLINSGSIAQIKSTMLGEYHIELQLDKQGKILESGSYLIGKGEFDLSKKLSEVEALVGDVIGDFKDAKDTTVQKITSFISSIESLVKTLNKKGGKMADSFSGLANNLNKQLDGTDTLISNFNKLAVKFKELNVAESKEKVDSLLVGMNNLFTQIQSDTGSIGKMLNDPAMYDNITEMIEEFDFLAADFQANPHRYVNINIIGKKPVESTIVKKVSPKRIKSGETKVSISLKRGIPDDMKLTFFDMVKKTSGEVSYEKVSSTEITIEVPANLDAGEHALKIEWNKSKDADYASIVKK